jgi:hypothetical protein
LFGLLTVASLLLVSCTLPPVYLPPGTLAAPPAASPTEMPESGLEPSGAVAELVSALEDAGAGVQWGGTVSQPFFAVPGWLIRMNGQEIQAFEYPDETARLSDSAQISPDGTTVGTTAIQWIGEPNFWANGKLIVLYVGDQEDVKAALVRILGEPLTQPGEAASAATPVMIPAEATATAAPAPQPVASDIPVLQTNVTLIQAAADVKIYAGPGTEYEAIGDVFAGQAAKVTGISADGNWWRVICPDDSEGSCWVSGDPKLMQVAAAQ